MKVCLVCFSMKVVSLISVLLGSASALHSTRVGLSRRDLSQAVAVGAAVSVLPPPSWGAGSTDLKTDRVLAARKYKGRVLAGRDYWANELPRQIAAGDWKSIETAVSVNPDPTDKKKKRQIAGAILGMVSPLELWASSFSRSATRSPETMEMLAAVEELKGAIQLLKTATASSVKDTGLLGFFGATKQPSAAERTKNAQQGLAQGSKALNAYIKVINVFLGVMDETPIQLV